MQELTRCEQMKIFKKFKLCGKWTLEKWLKLLENLIEIWAYKVIKTFIVLVQKSALKWNLDKWLKLPGNPRLLSTFSTWTQSWLSITMLQFPSWEKTSFFSPSHSYFFRSFLSPTLSYVTVDRPTRTHKGGLLQRTWTNPDEACSSIVRNWPLERST